MTTESERVDLEAALNHCALVDRRAVGRLLGTGPDLLALLHRLSTADLAGLAPGQGTQTTLLTAKGRIVERLFVHHLGDLGVLLLTGPRGCEAARRHLDRFTVTERTGLSDAGDRWVQWAVTGPAARAALAGAGCPVPEGFGAVPATLADRGIRVLGGDGLSAAGATVLADAADGGAVGSALIDMVTAAGGRPVGTTAWNCRRVLLGLPESGSELNEDHNPLEAGLWDAVSFAKGCYVGQEVVARLNTYDKVSRALRGFTFAAGTPVPSPGSALYREALPVGEITSAILPPGASAPVALGFVKRRSVDAGMQLRVGDTGVWCEVVELPFVPSRNQ